MEEINKAPMLLEFLFGEAAETAQRGASPRLMRWGEAFDEWMAEQGRRCKPSTSKQAKITWRRLLGESGVMPWELGQKDIEQHAAWMAAENYAATTISSALGIIASFYRWCDERQIDPECEAGFNPAAGVKRPKIQHYARPKLLSKGEVGALLGILEQDDSALGKRDYAFILARLRMGVALKTLQQLQWGQIERDSAPPGELSSRGKPGTG
jgi:site-specific recombinase XerD